MSSEGVPIVVICGFLGSGKTTILRRWRQDKALKNAPVIVHDLSEFGLDAELLADEDSLPTPGCLNNRVAALHGCHAREKLHESVANVLQEISKLDPEPDLVLCESTCLAKESHSFFLKSFFSALRISSIFKFFLTFFL